jgi:hypothetical protein
MAASGRPQGSSDIRILAALAALLAYAVLTLMPAAPGAAPGSEARDWLGTLYPQVAGSWVKLRIALALVAGVLLASSAPPRVRDGVTAEPEVPTRPRSSAPAVALALAVLALMSARSVNGFWPQTAWLALLYSPALVFFPARRSLPPVAERPVRLYLAALPLSLVWLVWRVAAAAQDGRQVDAVALWAHLERLLALLGKASGNQGVFAGGTWSDRSLILPLLQGGGLAEWSGAAPGLLWVATVHAVGTTATALLVAMSAGQVGGLAAAAAAATVFLFAPASLLAPLSPAPIFVAPLLIAALTALGFRCASPNPSPAALATLAATAGLATGLPQTLPTAVLAIVALGSGLYRARRLPALTRPAVTILVLAGTIFGLPSSDEVLARLKRNFGEHTQSPVMTRVLLEQSPIYVASDAPAEDASRLAPFVGALLAPVATRRAPASLVGDTLLDPLGSGLALAGIVIAVRSLRRVRWARWLLAGLLAGLLPGAFGSVGGAVPEMLVASTVPLSLLATLGLRPILELFSEGRARSAWLGLWLLGIATAGSVLFDVVNPRGLPASALGIGMEAARSGATRLTVLDHPLGKADFLHVPARTRIASAGRAAVRPLAPGDADWVQLVAELRSGDSVYLWSPALEGDTGVTMRLCRLVPDLRLFTLSDRTGQSRALAATAAGTSWEPRLPASRSSEGTCPPEALAAEADAGSEREISPDTPLPSSGPQKPDRANLSRSDLMGALLGGQDLTGADIRGASLLGAKLRGANLNGARLRGSDLREADLSTANLNDADLRGGEPGRGNPTRGGPDGDRASRREPTPCRPGPGEPGRPRPHEHEPPGGRSRRRQPPAGKPRRNEPDRREPVTRRFERGEAHRGRPGRHRAWARRPFGS